MRVKLLTDTARMPTRGSPGAIGLDLYADAGAYIPSRSWYVIPTGIAVAVPPGHYLRIAPRSGLAAKSGIDVLAGVVDADYRGEIKVVLMNNSLGAFRVEEGDRIAQAILEVASIIDPVLVEELDDTMRNTNGFGSTGNG